MADEKLKKRVEELQKQLDEMAILVQALREVVIRGKLVTRQELHRLIDEIDSMDGVIDGKVARVPRPPRGE